MDGKTIVLFLLLFLYGTEVMADIYNNPTNIEAGQGFAGETGKVYGNRFSEFDTPEMGLRATFKDLRNKMKEFDGDVDKMITKFAPPTENVTSKYIKRIKKSKKEGTGVANRMEELSNALLSYDEEIKKAGGGIVMNDPDKNYNKQRFI